MAGSPKLPHRDEMAVGSLTVTTRTNDGALSWGSISASNFLLVVVNADFSGDTFTPPSGWTAGTQVDIGYDGQSTRYWYKENASGSEASESWSCNASADQIWNAAVLTGRATSSALDFATTTTKNESGVSSPAVIGLTSGTATSGSDVVAFCVLDTGDNGAGWSFTAPALYTETSDTSFGWSSMGSAKKENVSAGALGTLSFTATSIGNATGYTGFVFSVKASGGGAATSDPIESPQRRLLTGRLPHLRTTPDNFKRRGRIYVPASLAV
jgi:hypothetical protein